MPEHGARFEREREPRRPGGERAELDAVQRELEAAARDREPDEAEQAIAEAERRWDLELRAMLAGVDLPRQPRPRSWFDSP